MPAHLHLRPPCYRSPQSHKKVTKMGRGESLGALGRVFGWSPCCPRLAVQNFRFSSVVLRANCGRGCVQIWVGSWTQTQHKPPPGRRTLIFFHIFVRTEIGDPYFTMRCQNLCGGDLILRPPSTQKPTAPGRKKWPAPGPKIERKLGKKWNAN